MEFSTDTFYAKGTIMSINGIDFIATFSSKGKPLMLIQNTGDHIKNFNLKNLHIGNLLLSLRKGI